MTDRPIDPPDEWDYDSMLYERKKEMFFCERCNKEREIDQARLLELFDHEGKSLDSVTICLPCMPATITVFGDSFAPKDSP